jgi:CHAD domain-containing protein
VPLELSITAVLARAGHRVVSTPVTQRRCDLYDTGDRRLAAAGAELSFNSRVGWVWRRDSLGHPKLATREWTAPPTTPAEQMRDWSRAYRRGRPLAVRARVRIRRRAHQLINDDATEGLTLLEERIDALGPAGWTARLHNVDVVGAAEGDEAVATTELIRGAALQGDATLALLRPALVRAPRLRLPDPHGAGTRELFVRSGTLSLIQWLHFDCELTGGGSPDALRKLRVGLRRLRSDLQTFAPILDREWAAGLRARLGDLGSGLGSVRDAEVLAARLAGTVASLPDQHRDAAQPLLDTATAQLAVARTQLLVRLAGDEYVELLDAMVVALTDPRWADGEAVPPVSRLARRPWRRLRDGVRSVDGATDEHQLHRVRILAKRARYAADACVPAVGEQAARCAGRLAALQTVLGEHQDAVVTQAWLQAQAGAAADLAFVAGELAAIELARRRRAEAGWLDAWKAASRKEDWAWLRS